MSPHVDSWLASHRRLLAPLALGLYVVSALLVVWAHRRGALPGEADVMDALFLRPTLAPNLQRAARDLVTLGSPPAVLVTITVVTAVVAARFDRRTAVLVPLTVGAGVIAAVAKLATGPTRVATELSPFNPSVHGTSPSGHTAYLTALLGLIAVLGLSRGRRVIAVVVALLLVATGAALVIRNAHFPGDVLAGYALGAAWLATLLAVQAQTAR